ncbi:LysR family transcriptional regulator [Aurantiacibacter flavus]|uniref:LysR family transcriptional regulator n=1 Tax=Aurantiacibacter flavus TaxID=3145232 RepID=A0ABV0D058_9SPHN
MTTTRQLDIFVKVAELGSVRLAADHLDVSQPTVSKHLKSLERHVGGQLFERRPGRKVALSPLGQRLLSDARESLAAHERMDNSVTPPAVDEAPILFIRNFMSGRVRDNYAGLLKAGLPDSTEFMLVDDREDIVARVVQTPGSMGVLRSGTLPRTEGIRLAVLKTEPLSLYAAPQLAEALAQGTLAAEEVSYLHLARTGEAESWGTRLLERAALGKARRVLAPQFIELALDKVLNGDGISVFFDWHVRAAEEDGRLVRLTDDSQLAYLILVAHPSVSLSSYDATVQAFARHG